VVATAPVSSTNRPVPGPRGPIRRTSRTIKSSSRTAKVEASGVHPVDLDQADVLVGIKRADLRPRQSLGLSKLFCGVHPSIFPWRPRMSTFLTSSRSRSSLCNHRDQVLEEITGARLAVRSLHDLLADQRNDVAQIGAHDATRMTHGTRWSPKVRKRPSPTRNGRFQRVRAEGLEPWTRRSQNLNQHAILQ